MSVSALLVRFFLLYGVLAIVCAAVLSRVGPILFFFVQFSVLSISVRWACLRFAKANGYYLDSSDRTFTGVGMLIICFSVLFGALILKGATVAILSEPRFFLIALLFCLLCYISIIGGISSTRKLAIKNGIIRE